MRAIAIIIVVLDHALHQTYRNSSWIRFLPYGDMGVYLFFVISGFLITTLLLHEQNSKNNINLGKFYIRRILRIFPVAYLYIGLIVILSLFMNLGITETTTVGAFFYLRNLPVFKGDWFFAHFWSLSYEEQYYMWYPWVVKKLKNNLIYLLWFLLAILLLIKSAIFYHWIPTSHGWSLLTGIDGILIGAIGGFYYQKDIFKSFRINNIFILFYSIIILVLAYILFNNILGINQKFLNKSLGAILLLIFLLINLSKENNLIGQFLSTKVMMHIGLLSYSIYIWQQIFTVPSNEILFSVYGEYIDNRYYNLFDFIKFPINLIGIYITALVSYYFYERYFLKLKSNFNNDN
jgi:peptidoglycan/LPS O-acetylase OafA/YrhL